MIEGLYDFATKWSLTGSVWLYSDPHFGDKELEVGIEGRPSAGEQVKLINSKVGKKGCLVCLGDVGDIEYMRQIRGYKVLITGNHDKGIELYKRAEKELVFDMFEYTKEEVLLYIKEHYSNWGIKIIEEGSRSKKWYVTLDNRLFDEVYGGPLMISPKIILSHEPLDIDWAFSIHGHTHDLKKQKEGSFCVCSDVINYEPVNLKNFIKSGILKDIKSIHRTTIDKATERKAARS